MIWIPIIITILGILYILSPIDIVPDFIPILGWADDLLVALIILLTWIFYLGFVILNALLITLKPVLIVIAIFTGIYFIYKLIKRKRKRRK